MKTLDLALLISGVCCFWNQKIFTNQMDWNEGISINQVADEATALYSGAKRPFNFTDLVDMDRMSDMTISPSGDKSVYVQWHYYKTTDKISRNLVMLSHSKNEPKSTVLTIPKQGVSASEPVWINNENVIFFQKDKEVANGVPQLMKINVNSLKIEPVFSNALSVEIANLKYKNGLLFFTASVKPSTEFFDECKTPYFTILTL